MWTKYWGQSLNTFICWQAKRNCLHWQLCTQAIITQDFLFGISHVAGVRHDSYLSTESLSFELQSLFWQNTLRCPTMLCPDNVLWRAYLWNRQLWRCFSQIYCCYSVNLCFTLNHHKIVFIHFCLHRNLRFCYIILYCTFIPEVCAINQNDVPSPPLLITFVLYSFLFSYCFFSDVVFLV